MLEIPQELLNALVCFGILSLTLFALATLPHAEEGDE